MLLGLCRSQALSVMQADEFEGRMFVAGVCQDGHEFVFRHSRYAVNHDAIEHTYACRKHQRHPVLRVVTVERDHSSAL